MPGSIEAERSSGGAGVKIAIVGPARFRVAPPFAGGMEMHTHVLAAELTRAGHDVTVFAAGGAGVAVRAMLPVPAARIGRLDVLTDSDSELAEHQSYLDAMLELGRGDHDVVHVNAVHHVPFACRKVVGGLVTGTLHSPPYPWLLRAVGYDPDRPMPLAAVSDDTARVWRAAGIATGVILNGIDIDAWPLGPGGHGAVWSGRLVPEKAPHLAIDAARSAGVPLTLFGPLHDRAYFEAEIEPRLGGDVRYEGHVGVDELALAVGRADVAVVSPVWDEPFGLVVAEALACGTPVAAFARGALPDLVDEDAGRLAPPGDILGLATALLGASALDRKRCRAAAVRRFSARRMAGDYVQWWESKGVW